MSNLSTIKLTSPPKNWKDWISKFRPSSLVQTDEWSGLLYPFDHPCVIAAAANAPGRIWTLLDVDGKPVVTSGMARANRIGCFITEVEYCGKLCDFFARDIDCENEAQISTGFEDVLVNKIPSKPIR